MAQNLRGRKLIAQLKSGEDLVQGILQICKQEQIQSAEIRASGMLRSMVFYPTFANQSVNQSAAMSLLQFSGWLVIKKEQLQLSNYAMILDPGSMPFRFLGGAVRKAEVIHAMISIDVFEDFVLDGEVDSQTGEVKLLNQQRILGKTKAENSFEKSIKQSDTLADSFRNGEKGKATSSIGSSSATWETLRNGQDPSQKEDTEADTLSEPKIGDFLDHMTFGRCTISKIDEEQDHLLVRVPSGRLVQLSLSYLRLHLIGTEGTAQMFKAERRR